MLSAHSRLQMALTKYNSNDILIFVLIKKSVAISPERRNIDGDSKETIMRCKVHSFIGVNALK